MTLPPALPPQRDDEAHFVDRLQDDYAEVDEQAEWSIAQLPVKGSE